MRVYLLDNGERRLVGCADIADQHGAVYMVQSGAGSAVTERFVIGTVAHRPEGGGAAVMERAVLAAPGQIVELLPGWVPSASCEEAHADDRRGGRARVATAARIAFRRSVLDCVLLDVSAEGSKVRLPEPVDMPDLVTLMLPGGESRRMRCRWQVGPVIGLEMAGDAGPPP